MLSSTGFNDPVALEALNKEVGRLSRVSFQRLHFPHDLELAFETSTRAARCQRLWFEGLIAILLFDAYLFLDFFFSPERDLHSLLLRLCLVTPLAVAVNISMRFQPGPVFREVSVALVACVAGATELMLESNRCGVRSAYALFAVTAVLVFANTVMRLRFRYALLASVVIANLDVFFVYRDHFLSANQKELGLFLTTCTLLLTLLANYSQNREERLNYLHCLREDCLLNDTRGLNARLARAADTDALTGLANRYAFNRILGEYWIQMSAPGALISVIVLDIDHFKYINDTFGHLYGDRVLQSIAQVIGRATRGKEDFAARFGGEEFVMFLPHTTLAEAAEVAERLRLLVEAMPLPAPDTGSRIDHIRKVTISGGVSTASPFLMANPLLLLESADRALYQAKTRGRNQICTSDQNRLTDPEPDCHEASLSLLLDPG
jgi:diguanylate cyclase (GGDEF)-like protein